MLDPPEKNLRDDDFLNRNPDKINLESERCRSVAQTVSESASTDNNATEWEKLEGCYRVARK
jgi:hypothetical protein